MWVKFNFQEGDRFFLRREPTRREISFYRQIDGSWKPLVGETKANWRDTDVSYALNSPDFSQRWFYEPCVKKSCVRAIRRIWLDIRKSVL